MRSRNEHDAGTETDYRELDLLSEVQATPRTSQRDLAGKLGISLGLTNLLLRSIGRKGYVRVTRAGWRRWLYALTPSGFSRKIQLMLAYIQRFLEQYQRVRQTLRRELEPLALHAESRVAILGTGDFAELVYLALKEFGIEEMDVYASGGEVGGTFLGMPVRDVATLRPGEYDRVVVALLGEASRDELRDLDVASERLVRFFATPEVRVETHQEDTS